jgi:predicted DNA-binding transcriptional regulator YafY
MEINDKNHDQLAFRLADMLYRLNNGEKLQVNELARRYSVNPRTIQRDLNERFAYLPLKREDGGYTLESFYLGKLSEQDIRHFAALSGVSAMFPALDRSFLRNLLDSRISAVYEVKGQTYEDVSRYERLMESLKEAILDCRVVSCVYDGKSRELHPYRLVHQGGRWYLAAVEAGQEAPKVFKLAKLERVSVRPETFVHDAALLARIAAEESVWFGEKMEVVMTVSREAAAHFRDRALVPGQQVVKELEDGGLILSGKVVHENQILPIVRYWIPHVRVVSPESVREACMESVRRYAGMTE